MEKLKQNRIKGASNQKLNKYSNELLELNMLLNYIDKANLSNVVSTTTLIHKRISDLEISSKSTPHKLWRTTEIKWLKDNYKSCTARELAIDLKRSTDAVQRMITKLGLTK